MDARTDGSTVPQGGFWKGSARGQDALEAPGRVWLGAWWENPAPSR